MASDRELRWKAWREEEKRMYSVLQLTLNPNDGWISHVVAYSDGVVTTGLNFDFVLPYTGVKDKKGNPIFEGDIIVACHEAHEPYSFVVGRHPDYCGYVLPYGYDESAVWGLGDDRLTLEIIGNEHQTPERMPVE